MPEISGTDIPLSLEPAVLVPDNTDGKFWGPQTPEHTESAFLDISADFDSSETPTQWIWLAFFSDDEPWFKLTFKEAAAVRDRLNYLLEIWDTLTDEQKAEFEK